MDADHAIPLLQKLLDSEWDDLIRDDNGGAVALLRPVTPGIVLKLTPSSPLAKTLCTWRNKNRDFFFDTREVTPESTIYWLRNLVGSADRLFFIIYDLEMKPVAQYGLRRLNKNTVELDNGILGVQDVVPDLYYKIQMRMLGLSHHALGFYEARARVLADNIPALFLHKRCGLNKTEVLKSYSAERDVLVMTMDLRDIEVRR